jgi:PTH1 family peptidyl-tRNA hydrolase
MFRRAPKPTIYPVWIIVGLGNPGAQYKGTRHNVGFEVIEELAVRHKIRLDKSKHNARYGLGMIGEVPVLLMKPLTYMNLSGRSVAPLARDFAIKPENILAIADDLDMSVGRVRLKPKGSAGGHNGHKSLIGSLGTQDYPRLKIGIGSVNRGETVDHVLGPFSREEQVDIREAIARASDGVEAVVQDGLEAGMNKVNGLN